jgi:hypothetical protein
MLAECRSERLEGIGWLLNAEEAIFKVEIVLAVETLT